MTKPYDVAVIGGGISGALCAALFARAGLRTALLEPHPIAAGKPDQEMSLRVSALNPAAVALLEALDVWKNIIAVRACPYRRMRIWEGRQAGLTFDCRDDGRTYLGYIIENDIVLGAVHSALAQQQDLTLIPADAAGYQLGTEHNGIILSNGETITATLVVAADGQHSPLRKAAGIAVQYSEYAQSALVLQVHTVAPQQDITWQRFTPDGAQAFLPLAGNHASLVWYLPPSIARELSTQSSETLLARLRHDWPQELGAIRSVEACAAFPLCKQHARVYYHDRVVLIGDAAHCIHPLAGLGANLGIADAAVLVRCMTRYGLENLRGLEQYTRERRRFNALVMGVVDGFYQAFRIADFPFSAWRQKFLTMADFAAPLKRLVIQQAADLQCGWSRRDPQ